MAFDSVFEAPFRFRDKKGSSGRGPDKNLMIDFTPEEARKAAKFLQDKADDAELGNSTIRKYKKGERGYDEVEGFTLWGSFWSSNESGVISPRA